MSELEIRNQERQRAKAILLHMAGVYRGLRFGAQNLETVAESFAAICDDLARTIGQPLCEEGLESLKRVTGR